MTRCEGYGQPLASSTLVPCCYEPTVQFAGASYCTYHAKVAAGLIEDAVWHPVHPQRKHRDELTILLDEWGILAGVA